MSMDVTKRFFSTAEAAELLGMSRVQVFRKIKAGEIPAQKVGRNFVIAAEDLLNAPLTDETKKQITRAVEKAAKEYGEAFKLLGKE